MIKPQFADGGKATDWSRHVDNDNPKEMAVNFEFPPVGVRVTIAVMVERRGDFVPDDDLLVLVKHSNVLVEGQVQAVQWASQGQ